MLSGMVDLKVGKLEQEWAAAPPFQLSLLDGCGKIAVIRHAIPSADGDARQTRAVAPSGK
jgi:hypothetical protein